MSRLSKLHLNTDAVITNFTDNLCASASVNGFTFGHTKITRVPFMNSADQTFTMLGTSRAITILNQQTNKPVSGATVTYNVQTATTNNQGIATLTNLPLGKSVVSITTSGKKAQGIVQLDSASTSFSPQKVFFKVPVQSNHTPLVIGIIAGVAAIIAFAVFSFFFVRRRKNPWLQIGGSSLQPPLQPVVGVGPTVMQ